MKIKILFILLLAGSIFTACLNGSKKKDSQNSGTEISVNSNLKLKIYYFHLKDRSESCLNIESRIKELLETNYSEELQKGTIEFFVLNANKFANKALVKKYEVESTALHLVYVGGGAENNYDLSVFALKYASEHPEIFKKGLKDSIDKMLSL